MLSSFLLRLLRVDHITCTLIQINFGLQDVCCALGCVLSLTDPDGIVWMLSISSAIVASPLFETTVEIILFEGLNKYFLLLIRAIVSCVCKLSSDMIMLSLSKWTLLRAIMFDRFFVLLWFIVMR